MDHHPLAPIEPADSVLKVSVDEPPVPCTYDDWTAGAEMEKSKSAAEPVWLPTTTSEASVASIVERSDRTMSRGLRDGV